MTIKLSEIVGGGYNDFWTSTKRYRVVKGSRGSKKSKTMALYVIAKMMSYSLANTLVVRKTERTLRDSCYSDLCWAIHRLGVSEFWQATTSPLELIYKPTGQKILFRGLDDPLKITSISVPHGVLCWLWIEEAYEISREADFDTLDESIRGVLPAGYFKQTTLTLNPWNEGHWIKKRFFDTPSEDVLAKTTTYLCNEWLDDTDRKIFEDMRVRNPRRFRVAGEGNWGVLDGIIYDRWDEKEYRLESIDSEHLTTIAGLDFGYTNDPTAFVVGFLDQANKKLYIWDELYEKGLSNKRIYDRICELGYSKERITADSAEPKSIDELKGYGLRVTGAKKGKDSILNGVQWIQDLDIVIHPRCINFIREIGGYTWKEDKFGKKINEPVDDDNHLMDALRYSLEKFIKGKGWII